MVNVTKVVWMYIKKHLEHFIKFYASQFRVSLSEK